MGRQGAELLELPELVDHDPVLDHLAVAEVEEGQGLDNYSPVRGRNAAVSRSRRDERTYVPGAWLESCDCRPRQVVRHQPREPDGLRRHPAGGSWSPRALGDRYDGADPPDRPSSGSRWLPHSAPLCLARTPHLGTRVARERMRAATMIRNPPRRWGNGSARAAAPRERRSAVVRGPAPSAARRRHHRILNPTTRGSASR